MPKITELFMSYQGEGIRTGHSSIFVRFSGCNFAEEDHPCVWCDTGYSQSKEKGKDYLNLNLEDEIKHMCKVYHTKEIVITGGEPLASNDAFDLIETLCQNYIVTVQTNGSLPIWKTKALWAMDIKCPSSGNEKYNYYINYNLLQKKDQVKFVVSDTIDYDFAKSQLKNIKRATVVFQPAWKTLEPETLVNWLKEDKLGKVVLSIQAHKYIFGDKRKGV
jgi:7-carboxy-7-deazaguanine synthase